MTDLFVADSYVTCFFHPGPEKRLISLSFVPIHVTTLCVDDVILCQNGEGRVVGFGVDEIRRIFKLVQLQVHGQGIWVNPETVDLLTREVTEVPIQVLLHVEIPSLRQKGDVFLLE